MGLSQKSLKLFIISKYKMGLSQKENLKSMGKLYFELFKILQCKIGHEFRKSHLFESLGKFLTFP